jgi:orotate phosphoribosyltransferase-like protein
MKEGYLITAPYKVSISSKKEIVPNLNVYRNTHYHVLNKLKIKYKELVQNQLVGMKWKRIGLRFQLFKPTKRRTDKANFSVNTREILM